MSLYPILLPGVFMAASVFFLATGMAQPHRAVSIETRRIILDVSKVLALMAIAAAIILK
jgi:hypothetical protein